MSTIFRPVLDGEGGSAFLVRAAEMLSDELGPGEVVARIRALAVPALADACAIALADDGPPATLRQRTPGTTIVLPLVTRGRMIGEIALDASASGRRFDPNILAIAEELARLAATAIDHACVFEAARVAQTDAERLFEAEHRARRQAEATSHRLARLQAMTAALSEALTASKVAETVLGQGLLATGAVAGSICTLTGDGASLQLVAHAGFPPEQLEGWQTFPLEKPAPLCDAAVTGRPILIRDPAEREERYPGLVQDGNGCTATAALPLIAEGRVIGTMGLTFAEPRDFDRDETTFLCALAQQCGQALERARAFEAERLARMEAQESFRRLQESVALVDQTHANARFLADATVMLSGSLEYETTLQNLARLAIPFLADWCMVYVLEEDGSIRRVAVEHADAEAAERARRALAGRELDPEALAGVPQVLRSGQSQLLEDATAADLARDVRHPETLAGINWGPPVTSWMCVPLRARGHTIGAMSFISADSGRRYTREDLSLAEELAARAALAADNARLFAERSAVARTLQAALLPASLPEIVGADVHGVYEARAGDIVGGDFYDVFETGADEWALVIGDVCGKGPRAAVLTALARYTIRAGAIQGLRPLSILSMLNEAILRHPGEDRFCTAVYAQARVRDGAANLTIVCGGHPLPLVLRADGSVETVGTPGTLLGMFPDPDLTEETVELGSGEALLLYTDGVTEAGQVGKQFGERALRELLGSCAGKDAREIAECVRDRVVEHEGGTPRDDVAVLVLHTP